MTCDQYSTNFEHEFFVGLAFHLIICINGLTWLHFCVCLIFQSLCPTLGRMDYTFGLGISLDFRLLVLGSQFGCFPWSQICFSYSRETFVIIKCTGHVVRRFPLVFSNAWTNRAHPVSWSVMRVLLVVKLPGRWGPSPLSSSCVYYWLATRINKNIFPSFPFERLVLVCLPIAGCIDWHLKLTTLSFS